MTHHESIIVLDYGSQYSQLIVRRIREAGVYSELLRYDTPLEQIQVLNPKGIILSGGPNSVYADNAPPLPAWVQTSDLPILGICYGMQLQAHALGGAVEPSLAREYGSATITVTAESRLFKGTPANQKVWMSHGDKLTALPHGWRPLAISPNSPYAAAANQQRRWYGLQFHPEVAHTAFGAQIIHNFLYAICECEGSWKPQQFIDEAVERIREQAPSGQVICALSGGVDSAVAALLAHKAVGDRLTCMFVDNGLLRLGEAEQVSRTFRDHMQIELITVDAAAEFLQALDGVVDPEQKRRIIGEKFIRIFERESQALDAAAYLVQGTLYPDVIESTAPDRNVAAKIKTHHNVGGLPEDMRFKLIEPLRMLFKDEVRQAGLQLGLPEDWVWRHPFPGPGLAVRVLGAVSKPRLDTLRQADAIFLEELRQAGLYRSTQQAFAVLLPVQSVGVMGDGRTYADVIALRAITTDDYMTADWARLPDELLARISSRIVNEVAGVNRVVYDISSKPPATIEWE